MPNFDKWFKRATGNDPFPYQRRFAEEGEIPELVDVPTGLGKTGDRDLGCQNGKNKMTWDVKILLYKVRK
jgi:hypothetical protein